jgi:hypothetical protein
MSTRSENIFNRRSDLCAGEKVARIAATNARRRQNQKCRGRFQLKSIVETIGRVIKHFE